MGVRRIGAASDSGNIEFATENKLHRINLLGALATTADFIQVPEQVGGIFVHPCGAGPLNSRTQLKISTSTPGMTRL